MTSPATKQARAVASALQSELSQHANMRTQYALALLGAVNPYQMLPGDASTILDRADRLATLDQARRVEDVAKMKAKLEEAAKNAPRIVAP